MTRLFRRGRRETAFTVPLYSPGKDEDQRYRRELSALCTALDCFPSDTYVCAHDMLGCQPLGHPAWQRWDCSTGQGYGFNQPVRFDHSITLIANDRSWGVVLGQPYMRLDDIDIARRGAMLTSEAYQNIDGISVAVVGAAPYNPKACVALLVGRTEVIERLAPRAQEVLQQDHYAPAVQS